MEQTVNTYGVEVKLSVAGDSAGDALHQATKRLGGPEYPANTRWADQDGIVVDLMAADVNLSAKKRASRTHHPFQVVLHLTAHCTDRDMGTVAQALGNRFASQYQSFQDRFLVLSVRMKEGSR